jgi:hypothetical protein
MGFESSAYTFADAQRWAKMAREKIESDVVSAVKKTAKKMQQEGRVDHFYKNRTWNLHKSTLSDVTYKKGEYVSLLWWIDPDKVTTKTGWNYGWIQNDGSLSRYARGKISPPAVPTDRVRTGVRHDDFVGRTWGNNVPKLQLDISNIFKRLV